MSTTIEEVPVTQETEVVAKARRRRFSAAKKLRVLPEVDRGRALRARATLTPVSAYRANAVGAKGSGEGAE
jgi:hypothetical protein